MRISLLTPGFDTANSQSLLYPLIVHRRRLAAKGVTVKFFRTESDAVFDADIVAADSKFLPRAMGNAERIARIGSWRERASRLVYFETGDSTAITHPWALPLVDRYVKAQLLRERCAYGAAHYGQRLFTDFAHQRHGIKDSAPAVSTAIDDPALLAKLTVGWNSGVADYSPGGGWRAAINRRLPLRFLLRAPRGFRVADAPRDVAINARFSTRYARETVANMRQRVFDRFRDRAPTTRISRRAYRDELRRSRLVLSPFGWGEINLRDYEAFIAGAVTVKPDMSHLETWPDLFRDGETIIAHRWDLEDLDDIVARALEEPERTVAIAATAQREYRELLTTSEGAAAFCERFAAIVGG